MGKIYNACALLHFPDLNLQYISDYLGFTNIEDFYRVFKRYQKVSVREYQTRHIGNGVQMQSEEEGLQILEYLLLHFQKPFQIREMEQELKRMLICWKKSERAVWKKCTGIIGRSPYPDCLQLFKRYRPGGDPDQQ